MENSTYSIFTNNRPIRVAFLVDPEKMNDDQWNRFFEYNQSIWGGRYNPIIFTNGESIEQEWWEILKATDPDVIKSLVPISETLLRRIEDSLSPYSIETPSRNEIEAGRPSWSVDNEPLSIYPRLANVTSVASHSMNPRLVLFNIEGLGDVVLRNFIIRNFGVYEPRLYGVQQALLSTGTIEFRIATRENFIDALASLSDFSSYVYPIQLCALPGDQFKSAEHSYISEKFTVVVGDSMQDIAYSWNHLLEVSQWKQSKMNQIWLPLTLANDSVLKENLRVFISRLANPFGGSENEIHFCSLSLLEEEIQAVADDLTQGQYLRKTINRFEKIPVPTLESSNVPFYKKEGFDLYRGLGKEEKLVLTAPEIGPSQGSSGSWMVDVFMQFWPERYDNFIGKEYWWQLPKRNLLMHNFFSAPSRVCDNGFPSVLFSTNKNTLEIKLPDERSIFASLFVLKNEPRYTSDPRNSIVSKPFDNVRVSDKGRYLAGMIKTFGDLYSATRVLQEPYWRRMFANLSGEKTSTVSYVETVIKNKVNKFVQQHGPATFSTTQGKDSFVAFVLHLVRQHSTLDGQLTFESFRAEAESELSVFNTNNPQNQFPFNEEDLLGAIQQLTNTKVLLMGLNPKCSRCGFSEWRPLDKIDQSLVCSGCGSVTNLGPEQVWYYKLNRLMQVGTKQGQIPVLLVLGQLLQEARSSFMYYPSLDIFDGDSESPRSDVDIVCIQDGEFIIGEIKGSSQLLTSPVFQEMAEIAIRVRPDKLLFSSLDSAPTPFVKSEIEKLKTELGPKGIEVVWYQLDSHIFEPSPVR